MPIWLSWLADAGFLVILIGLIKTTFDIGRNVGRITTRLDVVEKEVIRVESTSKNNAHAESDRTTVVTDRIEHELQDRIPLIECQTLFREISTKMGNMDGKLTYLVDEVKEMKKRDGNG
jgi:hypothetical protein